MAFWSSANLDPKRAFKFKVTFSRLGSNGTFLAQNAKRPQYSVSDAGQVDFLDKKFYFPGKVTWDTVDITFVDAVGAGTNVSADSYSYLKSAGWVDPVATGGPNPNFATISKAKATAGNLVLVQVLDSEGGVVDGWTLNNAFITKVTLNNLDYKSEDILTAAYTLRYDWATYNTL